MFNKELGKSAAPIEQQNRIVYGFRCTWWDSIDKAGTKPDSSLPCCPHCGSVLLESQKSTWEENIKSWALSNSQPEYPDMINWMRGKCFKNIDDAKKAWEDSNKGEENAAQDPKS